MKNTIKFTRTIERSATQEDVDKQDAWLAKHPGTSCVPYVIGEEIEDEEECELPACWAICSRCRGNGTHVNPNVDGHGISAEEWANDYDDESREMYMNGGYDVRCEDGCTDGKVLVVDEDQCKNEPRKSLLAWYQKHAEDEAREEAADRRTRFMESGGNEGSWT